ARSAARSCSRASASVRRSQSRTLSTTYGCSTTRMVFEVLVPWSLGHSSNKTPDRLSSEKRGAWWESARLRGQDGESEEGRREDRLRQFPDPQARRGGASAQGVLAAGG